MQKNIYINIDEIDELRTILKFASLSEGDEKQYQIEEALNIVDNIILRAT